MPESVRFVQRPAHTEAEDWIVYHPEITPGALMLYMRLRGAVMDPSSSAADWQKTTRFSIEQMTLLMPNARSSPNGRKDGSGGRRTVQRNLALLLKIGALRRVKTNDSQVPVYDFPMVPPKKHKGAMWGGAVGRAIRQGDDPTPETSVAGSPRAETVGVPNKAPLQTEGGAPYKARGGAKQGAGGCQTRREGGVLTCADGALKNPLIKNPHHHQEVPPPAAPAAPSAEDEEEPSAGQANGISEEHVPDEDDKKAVRALLAAVKVSVQGSERKRVLQAVSELRRASWTQAGMEALFASTQWSRILVPDRYVASKLETALEAEAELTPKEATEAMLAELRGQREQQIREIAACGGCGDYGRARTGWHGHGPENLKTMIYALENPEQAAFNRAMNSAHPRG